MRGTVSSGCLQRRGAGPDVDDLAGRTAVVTGAAGGLGLALARALAAQGMHLVLSDIDATGLAAAVDNVAGPGREVHALAGDVSRADDVARLAELARDRLGAVDLLCNNAGVSKSGLAWELTEHDWQWVLGVDLWGVVHGVRAFVPAMLAAEAAGRPAGHVVNTASMTALLPMPRMAAYSAAKAAVLALSESLQHDLQATGSSIGVSVFCPGWVPTRISDSARNRPSALSETAPAPTRRTTAGVVPRLTADEAAQHVLSAVRSAAFVVLTHPEYAPVINDRARRLGRGERPAVPPVW